MEKILKEGLAFDDVVLTLFAGIARVGYRVDIP